MEQKGMDHWCLVTYRLLWSIKKQLDNISSVKDKIMPLTYDTLTSDLWFHCVSSEG